jgi:hypothetical protein
VRRNDAFDDRQHAALINITISGHCDANATTTYNRNHRDKADEGILSASLKRDCAGPSVRRISADADASAY